MTDADFLIWLQSSTRRLNVLLEAGALADGVETTLYFASKPFASAATDTPANQPYKAVLVGGANIAEQLSLTDTGALSVGEAELDNTDRSLNPLLGYVWRHRPHRIYVGDVSWARADYRLVFDGLSDAIAGRDRSSLNLKCLDKLEQLKTSVSETKLGGATANKDRVIPATFGEVHNIEPLLADPATLKRQVHPGAIERVIETRDNGVPVATTDTVGAGTYVLNASPVNGGVLTNSVQGDKVGGVYSNTVSKLVQRLVTGFGNDPFVSGDLDAANLAAFETANPQPVGIFLPDPSAEQVFGVCQRLAASVGAQLVMSALSTLRLLKVAVPAPGTATVVTAGNMNERSLQISDRPAVSAGVKVAYCRNYTAQTNLQTGIPQEHKDLFAQEWLTVSASDPATASQYALTTEPLQEETQLLRRVDALSEAGRRLALRKVQRTIYRYVGRPELMLQELGAPQVLAHPAFGFTGASATSLTVSAVAKALTIDASGQLGAGQTVRIMRTSDSSVWMQGQVTSYIAATGALNVLVDTVSGAGTFTDWTVALCGQIVRIERDWLRCRATIEVYA